MKREILIKDIIESLSLLDKKIETNNKLGMFDGNSIAEDYYARLYSLIFCSRGNTGYYRNLNKIKLNFPAVDLEHSFNRECVQITSKADKTKVKKTVEYFLKYSLEENYNHLIIQGISEKKTKDITGIQYPSALKVTVRNRSDLITIIEKIEDINVVQRIREFLINETLGSSFNFPNEAYKRLLMVTPKSLERTGSEYRFDDEIHDNIKPEPLLTVFESSFRGSMISLFQELLDNAFKYGDATKFKILITDREITASYDGKKYNPNRLLSHRNSPKGEGARQLARVVRVKFRHLIKKLHYKYFNEQNNIRIVPQCRLTECTSVPDCHLLKKEELKNPSLVKGCSTIFLSICEKNRTSKLKQDLKFSIELAQNSSAETPKLGVKIPSDRVFDDKAEALKNLFPKLEVVRE